MNANNKKALTLVNPDGKVIKTPNIDKDGNIIPQRRGESGDDDNRKYEPEIQTDRELEDVYGFLELKKRFQAVLSEEDRCRVLAQVSSNLELKKNLDLQQQKRCLRSSFKPQKADEASNRSNQC